MNKYSQDIKDNIRKEYMGGQSINRLATTYSIPYATIRGWVKELPNNGTSRFYQKYEIKDDYAEIYIRSKNSYIVALIDTEDVERCKKVGIWSVTKSGYVINCKSGQYLHRFVMNCPKELEVDHIFHNPLDNRKKFLRLSNSSQQKMNTKLRVDNSSGHRGIYYDKSRNTWNVNIRNKIKRITKRFPDYESAVIFCEEKMNELHGEFQYKKGATQNEYSRG